MFNIRSVRDQVSARLAIIGRVDEATLHELYARAIAEELKNAGRGASQVKHRIQKVMARHPEKGWVMVDKEEWQEIAKTVDAFVYEAGAALR